MRDQGPEAKFWPNGKANVTIYVTSIELNPTLAPLKLTPVKSGAILDNLILVILIPEGHQIK